MDAQGMIAVTGNMPERERCEAVAAAYRLCPYAIWSRAWVLTRDLMLAGFCLLFAITPALSEEIFKPTGRYAQQSKSGRYLVKFTADWCRPCIDWDANELPALKAAGFRPTIVDSTHGNTWGVTSLPTFWIVDRATGKPVEKITGYASAAELIQMLREQPSNEPAAVVKKSVTTELSIYSGKAGSSHQNRASLIGHLLNEGIHSGRHTMAQLAAMTDSELNYMHESDHGWSHLQPQPVVRIQQSACPGGNCPSPQNRAQRRGGFLRGLFR